MFKVSLIKLSLCFSLISGAWAKTPSFPVKSHKSFFKTLGMKQNDDEINWSGGHWNPVTKTLYFCRNKWGIKSFKYHEGKKGSGFTLKKNLEFRPNKEHDFESITQSDLYSEKVWVVNENEKKLQEFDLASKVPKLLSEWNLKKITKGYESFEGLVFVPNNYLKKFKFKDGKGRLYPKAKSGRPGIFLISDQNTGLVYAIDLNIKGQVEVIGSYKLPLNSTRALDLDYQTGYLFALDGRKFVTFTLNSKIDGDREANREFEVKKLYKSPGPQSVEGLAVISNTSNKTITFMLTDDDNLNNIAIRIYEIDRQLIFN